MKIVFSVLILLALDLVIFYITRNVTKTYVKEQRVITQNLETKNQRDFHDYVIAVKEGNDIVYHSCFLVTDINMNVDVIVPDNLYSELDYKEKYRPC